MQTNDCVRRTFEQARLPPDHRRTSGLRRKGVIILRIELDKKESLDLTRENVAKLLIKATTALENCLWNVSKIQKLLKSWNWFVVRVTPAMFVLERYRELAGSYKEYEKAPWGARIELQLLVALSPLMHSNIDRASINVMLCNKADLQDGKTIKSVEETSLIAKKASIKHIRPSKRLL